MILNQGNFPMQETSELFWRHFWLPYWEGRSYWHLAGKTEDDAKHFTIYRKASHNKDYDPAENVTSAEIRNLNLTHVNTILLNLGCYIIKRRIESSGLKLTVGQRLRHHAPNAKDPGSIPRQGSKSHILQLKILHATSESPTCYVKISSAPN